MNANRLMLMSAASVPLPYLAWDFTTGSLAPTVGATTLATTRAGTIYAVNSSGNLAANTANVAAFEYDPVSLACLGLASGPIETNRALWCRDLTNAAWVKTNGTVVKDQTGVDGSANASSSFTATSANATCLQSITNASSTRCCWAYVKRLTGTGTVSMTIDGGASWVDVTALIGVSSLQTSTGTAPGPRGYTRIVLPAQTVTNPQIGFRLTTSGDAIAVDFVQLTARFTSPILTTSAAVASVADNLALSGLTEIQNNSIVVFRGMLYTTGGTNPVMFCLRDAGATNRLSCEAVSTANVQSKATASSVTINTGSQAIGSAWTEHRYASSFVAGHLQQAVDGSVGTDVTAGSIPLLSALTAGYIGSEAGATDWRGIIKSVKVYPSTALTYLGSLQ